MLCSLVSGVPGYDYVVFIDDKGLLPSESFDAFGRYFHRFVGDFSGVFPVWFDTFQRQSLWRSERVYFL